MLNEITAKAVWDTGAGITIVNRTFLERHSSFFEEIGISRGTDSTGATAETPLYLMQSVQIGKSLFQPHQVVSIDLSHINSKIEIPTDFILGYGAISQAHWIFDFPKKRWAISKMIK